MAHVPHLYVPEPWETDVLPLTDVQVHHLRRVLRRTEPAPVSYTDGGGLVGEGTLVPEGIMRGEESHVLRPSPAVSVAVAAPDSSERARFVVEKLAELGIDRLLWLTTEFGRGRTPPAGKAARWATGALEQSRGAWLMTVGGEITLAELDVPTWVVHPGGGPLPVAAGDVTLAIGPEGGFSPRELAEVDTMVHLGARVLRVETAAVVAAGLVLHHLGRMNT